MVSLIISFRLTKVKFLNFQRNFCLCPILVAFFQKTKNYKTMKSKL